MKSYAIIFFILVISCCSCRSSRHLDSTIHSTTKAESTHTSTRESQSLVVETTRDSVESITDETRYLRTLTLDTLGRIRSIQEEWRHAGSTELRVSSGRSSEVSVTAEKSDSTTKRSEEKAIVTKEDSTTDSRPVQGIEWFYIAGAIVIGILLILLALWLSNKMPKKFIPK